MVGAWVPRPLKLECCLFPHFSNRQLATQFLVAVSNLKKANAFTLISSTNPPHPPLHLHHHNHTDFHTHHHNPQNSKLESLIHVPPEGGEKNSPRRRKTDKYFSKKNILFFDYEDLEITWSLRELPL